MQLSYNNLIFEHPNPRPRSTRPNVYLAWDGAHEGGYRFCFECGGDAFAAAAHTDSASSSAHIRPLYATMSDKMYLSVLLNNPTDAPISASVSSTLGGKPLTPKSFACPIPPRTTHVEASFVMSVPVRSLGLPVGTHPLRVELLADNSPADVIQLDVPVGPSQVTGLELKNLESGEGLLTWKAVPEADIEYQVYAIYLDESNYYSLDRRQVTKETQFKFPAPPKSRPRRWWSVTARHVPTKLEGPPSDYVEDIGEQDGPYRLRSELRDTYTYVEFYSNALKNLREGESLNYQLLRSDNEKGPWVDAGHLSVAKRQGKLNDSENGKITGEGRAEIPDLHSNDLHQRTPPFYKVARVEYGAKVNEIDSAVLSPSGGATGHRAGEGCREARFSPARAAVSKGARSRHQLRTAGRSAGVLRAVWGAARQCGAGDGRSGVQPSGSAFHNAMDGKDMACLVRHIGLGQFAGACGDPPAHADRRGSDPDHR